MKLDRAAIQAAVLDYARKLNRYKIVIVVAGVVGIYGFLLWRIENLNNVQPSAGAITSQTNPLRSAHIDKQTVSQLESLRDNSVSVQTLFAQERNNPFQ